MTIEILIALQLFIGIDLVVIKETFRNPEPSKPFRHMVKDTSTNIIYIAGVNKIVKLSEDLMIEQSISTGPNEGCFEEELPYLCKTKKLTNSYSKSLVIDYNNRRLIACSILFKGFCKKYYLSDINVFDNDSSSRNVDIIGNSVTTSTVMFVAPGPGEMTDVVYVGTTITTTYERGLIPAYCSRNMTTFQLAHSGFYGNTSIYINLNEQMSIVHYVYGFSSDSFSYIATVQRANTSSDLYVTKLIRVCQNDSVFNSYAEVELICKYNSAKYNLLQAARIAKPGKSLAKALGISVSKDVLFATFSQGKHGTTDAANATAVCVYPLYTIKQIFTQNIQSCFDGLGNTGPDHLTDKTSCKRTAIPEISSDYCGNYGINNPINGLEPISVKAALILNTKVSAITVYPVNDYTVGFIGTQYGHIIKIVLESQDKAHIYEQLLIEDGAKIHEDMEFDKMQKNLYVFTDKQIYKLDIQHCGHYKNCAKCQGAIDPLCGWCFVENKCSIREECGHKEKHLSWCGNKETRCSNECVLQEDLRESNRTTNLPEFHDFTPKFGPVSGGTEIVISGRNLHAGSVQRIEIFVWPCTIKQRIGTQNTTLTCITSKLDGYVSSYLDLPLKVDMDGYSHQFNKRYRYMADSTITGIEPIQSTQSGGIVITVIGTNFHIVTEPKIIAYLPHNKNKTVSATCYNISDGGTQMLCPTPDISRILEHNLPCCKGKPVNICFLIEGMESVRHSNIYIEYFINPVFNKFTGVTRVKYFLLSEEELEIKGEYFHYGFTTKDVTVKIGNSSCEVSTMKYTMLLCTPKDKPSSLNSTEQRETVVVHVGYSSYLIGDLIYIDQPISDLLPGMTKTLSSGFIEMGVILGLVACLIMVLVFIIKRMGIGPFKRRLEDHEYKNVGFFPNEQIVIGDEKLQPDDAEQELLEDATDCWSTILLDKDIMLVLKDKELFIERHALTIAEMIGKGHFGCVYRGYLEVPDISAETKTKLVAVKTLNQNATHQTDVDDFIDEALRMKDFHHPSVLSLIGISFDLDDMPMVILPFMKHGDLLSYIRNAKTNPTIKDLIMIGIDIATGMEYLSQIKFVHRDLAARNCMLDESFQAVVGDFGLSRDVYAKDYYSSDNKKTMLPVKWMAPECLEDGTYTSKSDVWSFGIVLWELMTRGVKPYPEVDNWDILRFIKKGRRMPRPACCPATLYEIMIKCWLFDSVKRPNFPELVHDINEIITLADQQMKEGNLAIYEILQTYVNTDACKDYHCYDDTFCRETF